MGREPLRAVDRIEVPRLLVGTLRTWNRWPDGIPKYISCCGDGRPSWLVAREWEGRHPIQMNAGRHFKIEEAHGNSFNFQNPDLAIRSKIKLEYWRHLLPCNPSQMCELMEKMKEELCGAMGIPRALLGS